jgi:hypothetical protein
MSHFFRSNSAGLLLHLSLTTTKLGRQQAPFTTKIVKDPCTIVYLPPLGIVLLTDNLSLSLGLCFTKPPY